MHRWGTASSCVDRKGSTVSSREIPAGISVVAVLAGGVALPPAALGASDCASSRFCAYRHQNFGTRLLSTVYTGTADVDVADDLTTSLANDFSSSTGRWWCGVNAGSPWDTTITMTPAATEVSNVGSSDKDKIDWFYTRLGAC